jgi:hypothetical protein
MKHITCIDKSTAEQHPQSHVLHTNQSNTSHLAAWLDDQAAEMPGLEGLQPSSHLQESTKGGLAAWVTVFGLYEGLTNGLGRQL